MVTTKEAGIEDAATEDFVPGQTIRNGVLTYGWIALVGWILFEVLRRKIARAYYCRSRSDDVTCPVVESSRSSSAFRWIVPLLKTSDDAVFEYCGLDTLFFLRFLRLVQKVAVLAIVLSGALFPIYYMAGETGADALYRMTLSSLSSKEPWRFWFTVATMYLITAWTCYLLWREFEEFVRRRHEFMGRKHTQQYSVILNGLPKHLSTQQTLRNYLNLLYPRQVLHVYVAVECGDLEKLVVERVKVRNKLEHSLAKSAKTGDRVLAREKMFGAKVDAIELYEGQLKALNEAVEMEVRAILRNQAALAGQMLEASTDGEGNYQFTPTAGDDAAMPSVQTIDPADDSKAAESAYIKSLRQSDKKDVKSKGITRGAGFVTFNSLAAAQSAQQVLQSSDPTEMHIESAPHVDEVVWENVGVSYNTKSTWALISTALTCAIILFWTIPTGLIVSLSKVESIGNSWKWLGDVIKDHPWVGKVLEQLSPLMLVVMSALAPIIFGILSKREGHATSAQIGVSLLNKLIAYQVFVVFLLPIIGGTIIDTVMGQKKEGEDLTDISALATKVSKAIPLQSAFFITYLIVQTFLNLTLEFLRVKPMIKAYIYHRFAPKLTPRQRASPWFGLAPLHMPGDFGAMDSLSQYYTVLIFVLVFCSVAPIMNYFALLFLLLSDVVLRWAVLCVYDPSPYSEGAYFPSLYNFCVYALLFAQVIMAILLGTKEVALPATISIILPFLTGLFHLFITSRYPRTAINLPLNECVLIDSRRARQHDDLNKTLDDMYMQPAMRERAALEPDYQGLSSDPDETHRIASPQASEKFSGVFIMGDVRSETTASPDAEADPSTCALAVPATAKAVSTTTPHTRATAPSTASTGDTFALLSPRYYSTMHSPLAFSSIAVSQSERSRSSSYTSASDPASLPKHLHQHLGEDKLPPVTATNPLPVLVHVKKERVLFGALVFTSALAVLTLIVSRGVVVATFTSPQPDVSSSRNSDSNAAQRQRLDDYNFYVGAVTALTIQPLLALVALVVPVALLCFATRAYMQTHRSWHAKVAIFLVTNVIVWLLSNSLHAANVRLTVSHIEPALRSADLAVDTLSTTSNSSSVATDSTTVRLSAIEQADARNTILRSAVQSRVLLESSAAASSSTCERESPRRLPALVEFGFPTREWLRDVLPTAPAPRGVLHINVPDMAATSTTPRTALPFAHTTAQHLFSATLHLMDDFFRDPTTESVATAMRNATTLELELPSTFNDNSDSSKSGTADLIAMETALFDAMQAKLHTLFSAASPLTHFAPFHAASASLEFARYQLSPQIAFEAMTLDVPLDARELRRRVVLQDGGDTTSKVQYGNLDSVFEINAKEECSALGCVVSPRGKRMSVVRADTGSQVRALAMCVDSSTNTEDWHASVDASGEGSACTATSDRSAIVFSFAKRIVGDELRVARNSTAGVVTLSNATKFYTITVGRLAWTVLDIAETFHATCEADEGCDGLTFPLQSRANEGAAAAVARHVVVGQAQLPRAQPYARAPRQLWATQLVGVNAQEIDDGGALKSDFVLPRNFQRVVDWDGAIQGAYCEVERGRFLHRVVHDHLFSEHSLQPAYTAALFWLLQRAVVHNEQSLSMEEATTTLAFSGNVEIVHAELSAPRFSVVLTCTGCVVLLVLALAVQLGGKRREAHIERFLSPHQLAQLVLGGGRLPRHLVKCDVLRVANDRLGSSEHLDEFEISGLALRHCKDPDNVLYVPKQTSTTSSSFLSTA